ncbi:hypothetical protein PV08_05314 [Exophiala spinifera]|uniref:Transcription factor domain-containing protein n=1 Tax=Exophiala spinifera TaxID=91928 RepID=A0A0D2BVF9_9EURO|nr:uncharacterized protein PV08_05314 [Exophiala spinifera]KIW15269.1 hypothetical protein PV08_05314 [Exophiala spinifera]
MPIGRPRIPGTEEERAGARRAKVRANVQAFRRRQREKKLAEEAATHHTDEADSNDVSEAETKGEEEIRSLITFNSDSDLGEDPFVVSKSRGPWLWAIPSEFGVKLIGTKYQDAFIQILQDRYLPSQTNLPRIQYEPKKRFSICCSTWITSATLEVGRPECKVLMQTLLAASLAIIGRDQKDEEMTLHAAFVQTQALQKLRLALTKYSQGDRSICPTMLSLTALTCAMSELIANQSWDNFNRHIQGVGALIFHGGPEGLSNQSAQEHFYGYRALQTPFLFMNRQRAFLSSPEWISFSWKKDLELAQHPVHTMLDIGLRILPELVKQDMPKKWTLSSLWERLERTKGVARELTEWENTLRSQHGGALYKLRPATWVGLDNFCFDFPLLSTAIAFTVYTAVRIHVAALIATIVNDILIREPDADVEREPAVLEALRWSRTACQCLEFFHTGRVKIAGRIVTLWPLETAWEFCARTQAEGVLNVSREIAWCRGTAEKLSKMGIPPFQWR